MIRKLFTTLLCLLLTLALPLSALAATEYTLSIIPGDELSSVQAAADFFDSLAFRLTAGDDSAKLSVVLNDTDVASAAFRADENGVYVKSDTVSPDVLFYTWEECFEAMEKAVKTSGYDDETAALIQDIFTQGKEGFLTDFAAAANQDFSEAETPEKGLALAKETFQDDPAMVQFIEGVYSRMIVEEGEFSDETHDSATGKLTVVLTQEDYVTLCDTAMMRKFVAKLVEEETPEATEKEKSEKTDEMIAELKELYRKSDISIALTALKESGAPVSLDLTADLLIPDDIDAAAQSGGAEKDESETVHVTMDASYRRLTTDEGVQRKAQLSMTANGEEICVGEFDALQAKDKTTTATLALLAGKQQITLAYDKAEADGVKDRTVAIYARSNAAAIIAPAASDRPLLSFNLKTREVEDEALKAVEAATHQTAERVSAMTDAEYQEFATDMQTRSQQTLYTILNNLPESVLDIFLTSYREAQTAQ